MQIKICDRASFAVNTKRTYTDEGFLIVPGRVARIGTQEYLASELGLTGRNPNDIIKVNRPESSVFDKTSLESYNGADITIEHPSVMVDAESHSGVSKGVVRGVGSRDGDFVTVDLMIKSRDAINAVESGKVQLSAGYTAIYDEAPEDSPFDFIQREIRVNHVALVDRARAGAQARLFDNNPGVTKMFKVTLDSGRSVEVQDAATATLVTDTIERLNKRATDAEQATIDAHEQLEKVQAEKDAHAEELEEEKKKSSDSAIAKRVEAIAATNDNARKIAGDEFTCDSMSHIGIQRAALAVKRPTVDWSDKSDIYVQTSFDAAIENLDAEPTQAPGQLTQFAKDAATNTNDGKEVKLSAYDSHKAKLANAWEMKGE